jgi:hypothetical protein
MATSRSSGWCTESRLRGLIQSGTGREATLARPAVRALPDTRSPNDSGVGVSGFLLILALWVLMHPWVGITHDAILYAAQASLHLRPDVFAADLFFTHGSQDRFTLFGRLHATVAGAIGLVDATRVAWAVAQVLWACVTLAWVSRWVAPGKRLLAAALALGVSVAYGPFIALRVAEPFLTARSLAEPVAFLAIFLAASGQRLPAALCVAVAGLLHPIMALPAGFAVLVLIVAGQRIPVGRVALAVGATLCALPLLAYALGRLTLIDDAWWTMLRALNTLVVPQAWTVADWARIAFPVTVLLAAVRRVPVPVGRALHAVLVAAIVGVLLALFSSVVRWELGVQAQFWRMAWVAACAAPIAATLVVLGPAGATGANRPLFLAALPLIALGGFAQTTTVALLQGCVAIALWLGSGRPLGRVGVQCAWALLVVCALMTLWAAGLYLVAVAQGVVNDATQPMRIAVTRSLGWCLLPVVVVGSSRIATGLRRTIAPVRTAVAVLALIIAAALVDARSADTRALDHAIREGIDDWASVIPSDANVFWPGHLASVWFGLGRASYASAYQGAGVVFARGAGFALEARIENLRWIGDAATAIAFGTPVIQGPPRPISRSDLVAACTDQALGFVVLSAHIDLEPLRVRRDPRTGVLHRLYGCDPFRSRQPASPGSLR